MYDPALRFLSSSLNSRSQGPDPLLSATSAIYCATTAIRSDNILMAFRWVVRFETTAGQLGHPRSVGHRVPALSPSPFISPLVTPSTAILSASPVSTPYSSCMNLALLPASPLAPAAPSARADSYTLNGSSWVVDDMDVGSKRRNMGESMLEANCESVPPYPTGLVRRKRPQ